MALACAVELELVAAVVVTLLTVAVLVTVCELVEACDLKRPRSGRPAMASELSVRATIRQASETRHTRSRDTGFSSVVDE